MKRISIRILTGVTLIIISYSTLVAKELSFADAVLLSDNTAATGLTQSFSNIEAADVDGDGDMDIVISQASPASKIVWLENDGGDFVNFPRIFIDTAIQSVTAIQLVDLDNDGDVDVVGVDKVADQLLWLENQNAGQTWTKYVIETGVSVNSTSDISIADIDADGDLDVVVAANTASTLYWYENGGAAATWTKQDTGIVTAGNVSAVATGDLTLDGAIDIVYGTESGSPYIKIVGNQNGDGSSWASSTVAAGTAASIVDIQLADLDLDGLAEIYFHETNFRLDQLTYSFATSSWSSVPIIASGVYGKTSFADMDNDGDLDILVGNSNNLSWFENTDGLGGNWTERILVAGLTTRIEHLLAVDLDNDGDLEIVTANNEDGYVYAHDNLLFHAKTQYDLSTVFDSSHTDANHVVTGLLNGDQYQDIISANKSSTGMEIFFFAGDGTDNYSSRSIVLSVASTIDSQITVIELGDMDNDGDLDIVFAADGSDSIYMIENLMNSGPFKVLSSDNNLLGASWGGLITIASASGISDEIQLSDINADGMLDVVALDKLGDRIIWFNNNGLWAENEISTNYNSPGSLKVADFNSDGNLDVVVASGVSTTRWFSNDNGDGTTWTETTVSNNTGYQIDVADMDSDGDIDIITSRNASQNITWYANNGNGTAWSINDTLVSTASFTRELAVLDVDADGDMDILTENNNGKFYLFEYDQDNLWSLGLIKSGLHTPSSFAMLDYDLDGDLDAITKGITSSELITIENIGGQFGLVYTSAPAQNIEESETRDVVTFVVTHNGELLDSDLQVSKLNMGFLPGTGCTNTPMISSDINPLISEISVYLDDGSGSFELQSDTLVFTENGPLTLTSGQISLNLTDQDVNFQISPQMSNTYFVALKIRPNASAQTCRGFTPFFFVGNTPGILDNFTAQDRDSNLTLSQAGTTESIPSEQLIIATSNIAPTTTGIADKSAMESVLFTTDVSGDFSDPDGDTLTYSAGGLPLSLTINANTGIISGTPTNIEVVNSPFTVTVVATDPQGALVNSSFSLVVNPFVDLIFANGME